MNCRDCKHSFKRVRTNHLGCLRRPMNDKHLARPVYWPADQSAPECKPTPTLIARIKGVTV